MRKSLIALLLITSATPALAAPGDRDNRSERRDTVERVRDTRSDDDSDRRRKASSQSSQSSQPTQSDRVRPRIDGQPRAAQQDVQRRAPAVRRSADNRRDAVRNERQEDSVRTWPERDRRAVERPAPVVRDQNVNRGTTVPVVQREARRPAIDLSQRTVANKWRNDWRRDRRYDWRSHRSRNRSLFRIGYYYDPFGYDYRRFGYGYQLYPAYYSSRYWLNDPFMYRLPPAWGPYRWVRYWDDALLVDTRTGMVVDVIYSFFW